MKFFRITALFFCAVTIFFAAGCLGFSDDSSSKNEVDDGMYQVSIVNKRNTIAKRTEKILSRMTIQEKIGQMVFIGVQGTSMNEDMQYMLSQYHVGGVILFDRNMQNPDQVRDLTTSLQSNASRRVPLFIAVDEEGGSVVRMPEYLEVPPSQRSIGETGDIEQAKIWAIRTAHNLQNLGINLNFAPVLDLRYNQNDTRSYAEGAVDVASFAQSAVTGYRQEKFLFTIKHFPGIGRGIVDSHEELSEINEPFAILDSTDVVPFKNVISTCPSERFMIMVSHFKYPSIDPENPASVSSAVITDFLRNSLEYDGIVITDDLEMGAISKHMSFRDSGIRAIQAGCDIALICHEYEHQQEIYNGILDAVKKGIISEDRIDESVRRILKAKLYADIIPEEDD